MLVKAIFRVNLQFGNVRSYELAIKNYNHSVEQLYKGEVCIKPEVVFDETTFSLSVPNLQVTTLEKTIKNTAYLLESLSKFAQSGKGFCWILENGKPRFTLYIEPDGEKTSIQHFLKGKQLAKEAGNEELSINELSLAINKFGQHWTAYERRGYVYSLIGRFEDAINDFNKSLSIYPFQGDSYFSRARVHMLQSNFESAIPDFEDTCKNSNPQQPLFWAARRMKAESCIQLNNFAEAAKELKFLTDKKFSEDNPNYVWVKTSWFNYSFALYKNNQVKEAKEAFVKFYKTSDGIEPIIEGKFLEYYNEMTSLCNLATTSNKSQVLATV